MVYLSEQLKIVCRGGDAVGIIAKVFNSISRKLHAKKPPVITIQAVKSTVIILNIHKD